MKQQDTKNKIIEKALELLISCGKMYYIMELLNVHNSNLLRYIKEHNNNEAIAFWKRTEKIKSRRPSVFPPTNSGKYSAYLRLFRSAISCRICAVSVSLKPETSSRLCVSRRRSMIRITPPATDNRPTIQSYDSPFRTAAPASPSTPPGHPPCFRRSTANRS